ncbi:MAG: HAD family hydrolase [Phycisphaeraceae bacterium]|nr:HAD family hydrolase [Phycisphaeraceae bacterium]
MTRPTYLLLFDIDGTLLRSDGVGRGAMQSAAARLFGESFSFQGVAFAGNLDPLIFAEAAQRHQLVGDDHHDRFRSAYVQELSESLSRRPPIPLMPGVLELLDRLKAMPQVVLGLLSGNYAQAAPLKLAAAGINVGDFPVTAFGDEGSLRQDLVTLAMQRYLRSRGEAIDPRQVLVIGDTPRDIEAARAHGCVAVGVATGGHSAEELQASGADLVLEDFAEPGKLLALLAEV